MQLIYLAAGKGSRLGKKYSSKPKCFANVNQKKIIDYNKNFFSQFSQVIIVTGYKSKQIKKKFLNKKKFLILYNKNYRSTNMVYSMFLAENYVKEDVIICYGDIIFNNHIITEKLFKSKKTIMPLNSKWYKYWLQRMDKKEALSDAENILVSKKYVLSIGSKIYKKIPKFQFMGIIKFKLSDFKKLSHLFFRLNKFKIDFTNFINLSLKKKIIKICYFSYNNFWLENDSANDIKVNSKILKKLKKW
tara:strand:- start:1416 stop:2153 length:738 start_codon:yes stop_codon:yes gene_type:complete